MRNYLKGECPNCGCRLLYKEPATADGAAVLDADQAVRHGDTVTRCDGCGEHIAAERPTPAKSKPAKRPAPSKPSKPARSSSAKGKRRPQRSKRQRARSGSRSR